MTDVPAGEREAEPPRDAGGPGQPALVHGALEGRGGVAVLLDGRQQVPGALGGDGLDDERVHVPSLPL